MASNENCVIRMGGLGDLANLSSSLLALAQKEPWRPLVLATLPHNVPLLQGVDYLDRVIPLDESRKHLPAPEVFPEEDWFRIYDCRWGVEPPNIGPGRTSWENYIGRDRSDIFDDLLGVRNGHKKFSLPVDQKSLGEVRTLLSKKKRLIGLAPTSKSPVRCMPPEFIRPMANLIIEQYGAEVVLFGKTEDWSKGEAGIHGVGINNLIDILSVKEMVALISLLDVVISPDTGIYHVAAALEKKCLALFGNIHPNTRTTYYPTVKSLHPTNYYSMKELSGVLLPCNPFPCWDVPYSCSGLQPGQYGAHCIRLLTPERIVDALKELI